MNTYIYIYSYLYIYIYIYIYSICNKNRMCVSRNKQYSACCGPHRLNLVLISKYRLAYCFSNRGDEVSMCHFKENHLWLKTYIFCIGGPKMDLKRVQMVPKWSQMLPSPSPASANVVSKRLLPGGKQIKKKHIVDELLWF